MSKVGKQLISAAKEAVSIARGEAKSRTRRNDFVKKGTSFTSAHAVRGSTPRSEIQINRSIRREIRRAQQQQF